MKISDFFKNEYPNQASYDNLRKIASCIDGLKNSNRKVIHTILDKSIYDLLKVMQLSSKSAEYTDYLHGSLDGVIVSLAADYLGTNQLPLLAKKGNFGTRAIPEASASRYIFAKGSPILPKIFKKEDREILIHQNFEGSPIEPKFFVPVLPMLLINGSRGVSSGFSQLILPRNKDQIISVIKDRLDGKDIGYFDSLSPYIEGFKGTITRDPEVEAYRWIIEGSWTIKGKEVHITELPPDTKLVAYLNHLEDLKDAKKIKSYEDLSDGDNFQFKIKFSQEVPKKETLIKLLKLRCFVTENFTCLDENNKIAEYSKPSDILENYYRVKLEYLNKRKQHLLSILGTDIGKLDAQLDFINMVLNREIDLREFKTEQLIEKFKEKKYPKLDNWSYLLRIPVSSMTTDKKEHLEKEIRNKKNQFEDLSNRESADLWKQDFKDL